jgi:hypothetical protein
LRREGLLAHSLCIGGFDFWISNWGGDKGDMNMKGDEGYFWDYRTTCQNVVDFFFNLKCIEIVEMWQITN